VDEKNPDCNTEQKKNPEFFPGAAENQLADIDHGAGS